MSSVYYGLISSASTQHDSFHSLHNDNTDSTTGLFLNSPRQTVRSPILDGAPDNQGSERCSSTEPFHHTLGLPEHSPSSAPEDIPVAPSAHCSGPAMLCLPSLPLMTDRSYQAITLAHLRPVCRPVLCHISMLQFFLPFTVTDSVQLPQLLINREIW